MIPNLFGVTPYAHKSFRGTHTQNYVNNIEMISPPNRKSIINNFFSDSAIMLFFSFSE
jgi:hypothetical protein